MSLLTFLTSLGEKHYIAISIIWHILCITLLVRTTPAEHIHNKKCLTRH
jgi:hypothetical protein